MSSADLDSLIKIRGEEFFASIAGEAPSRRGFAPVSEEDDWV